MTRPHYSLFFANSAQHERRILISTRALQRAITPGGITSILFNIR